MKNLRQLIFNKIVPVAVIILTYVYPSPALATGFRFCLFLLRPLDWRPGLSDPSIALNLRDAVLQVLADYDPLLTADEMTDPPAFRRMSQWFNSGFMGTGPYLASYIATSPEFRAAVGLSGRFEQGLTIDDGRWASLRANLPAGWVLRSRVRLMQLGLAASTMSAQNELSVPVLHLSSQSTLNAVQSVELIRRLSASERSLGVAPEVDVSTNIQVGLALDTQLRALQLPLRTVLVVGQELDQWGRAIDTFQGFLSTNY